jgi:hypothetical protein
LFITTLSDDPIVRVTTQSMTGKPWHPADQDAGNSA